MNKTKHQKEGVICGCFSRCEECYPLTKEERKIIKKNLTNFRKRKIIVFPQIKAPWPSLKGIF